MLKYKLLVAAASAALFAWPAGAQDAGVKADVQTDVRADAQTGVQTGVQTDAQTVVETDAGAGADAQVEAQTNVDADAGAAAGEGEAPAATGGAGVVTVATPADIRAGLTVQDPQGGVVGTVESVDAEGAVVSTGNARAKLPLASFGKNDRGLVISLTRAELEAAVSAQTPS